MDFLVIADPVEALGEDVQAVRRSNLLPPGTEVCGFVYDLESRAAREVGAGR
ncbi:MAG TPA: hypothetical protein VF085_01955 [Solirubrobacterales bacterium]